MGAMVSQITGVSVVCSIVCSGADNKTSKLRVTGLCEGNPPVTGGFPSQKASSTEKVSIWSSWKREAKKSHILTSDVLLTQANYDYVNV